MVNWNHIS